MLAKVAVIDDNEELTDVLAKILTEAGYNVITHNTVQFINFLQAEKPDIVLLDIWFDQDDLGKQLAQAFHQHDELRHIPVILMSSDNEVANYADKVNADAYLEKPFEMQELFMLLKHVSKTAH